MITITCDLCEKKIGGSLSGRLLISFAGEPHPHYGSELTELHDVCQSCLLLIPDLSTPARFSDLKKKGGAA